MLFALELFDGRAVMRGSLALTFFAIAIQPLATYYPAVSELKDVSWMGTGSVSASEDLWSLGERVKNGNRLPNVEAPRRRDV
jgi:hypothetical protein